MKTTVYFSDFCDSFSKANRTDQFSYNGLRIIYDYLTEVEESCGSEFELDVIGICCEYSEDYCDDIASNYNIDISDCIDEVTTIETVMNYLQEHTSVAGVTKEGTIVYAQF